MDRTGPPPPSAAARLATAGPGASPVFPGPRAVAHIPPRGSLGLRPEACALPSPPNGPRLRSEATPCPPSAVRTPGVPVRPRPTSAHRPECAVPRPPDVAMQAPSVASCTTTERGVPVAERGSVPARWAWPIAVADTPQKPATDGMDETPPKVSGSRAEASTPQGKPQREVRVSRRKENSNKENTKPANTKPILWSDLRSRAAELELGPLASSGHQAGHVEAAVCPSVKIIQPPVEVDGLPPPQLAALMDFSVLSPYLGRNAAAASFQDLPSSARRALQFLRSVPNMPCTPCNGAGFLPPMDSGRPTLILDLDETLVHCSRGDKGKESRGRLAAQMYVQFEDSPSEGSVRWRPFAQVFLSVVSRRFEVVVFTASDQSYADQVINKLDPNGYISHRLYRRHCTHFRGAFFKECGLVGRPLTRSILVDNSPISVACNADNGILIKSWYGDPYDRELIDLVPILEEATAHRDVTQYLAARYGLGSFFDAIRESGQTMDT